MDNTKIIIKSSDLGTRELLIYSFGYMGYNLGLIGVNIYLNYFWSDIALLPLTAIGAILFISRIFDGFTDIIVGFLMDRTKNKYGKARPWLLWMALPSTLSLAALFYVPNIGTTGKIIYALISYNLVAFFFLTATTIPLQALTALITRDGNKRLSLNMMGQLFGTAAMVIGNMYVMKGVIYFGDGSQGYFRFFGILAIVTGGLLLITFSGTREKVKPIIEKNETINIITGAKILFSNKYWVIVTLLQIFSWLFPAFMAIAIYYMTWMMGNPDLMGPFMSINFIAMLVATMIMAPLSQNIGKSTTAFLGMLMQVVGGLITLINPYSVSLLMFSSILRGAGPAALLGTRLAFTSDVVEYGEWKTGVRTEGLIFSGTSVGQKVGQGIGGAVVAVMLSIGGYVGGASVQSQSAISAINITFTWLCALASIFGAICLVLMGGLKKQMPIIMKELEERKISIDSE